MLPYFCFQKIQRDILQVLFIKVVFETDADLIYQDEEEDHFFEQIG